MLEEFLAENGYELYNVEFVKEGRDWFLRVYIDLAWDGNYVAEGSCEGGIEGAGKRFDDSESEIESAGSGIAKGISTDDCEKVSRFLSEKLDETDPIEQNYYLEVSSPGIERALLKESDYKRYAGRFVNVTLYQGIDGKKTFYGKLEGLIDGDIVITDEKGNRICLPLEKAAKTKLAITGF